MIRNNDNTFVPSSDAKKGLKLKFAKYTDKQTVALVVVYGNMMGTLITEDENINSIEKKRESFQPMLQSSSIYNISITDDEQLVAAYCIGKESHVSSCDYDK